MRMNALEPIAEIAEEIHNLATLLDVVLAGGDADTVLKGMRVVVHEIRTKSGILHAACAGI